MNNKNAVFGISTIHECNNILLKYKLKRENCDFFTRKYNELNELNNTNTISIDKNKVFNIIKVLKGYNHIYIYKRREHYTLKYYFFIIILKLLFFSKSTVIHQTKNKNNLSLKIKQYFNIYIWILFIIGTLSYLKTSIMQILIKIKDFIKSFILLDKKYMRNIMKETSSKVHSLEHTILTSKFRNKKLLSTLHLLYIAVSHLILSIIILPVFIVYRIFTSFDRKNILLISHESKTNGAPKSLIDIVNHIDKSRFTIYAIAPSVGLLTEELEVHNTEPYILPVSQIFMQNPNKKLLIIHLFKLIISLPYLILILISNKIKTIHTNVFVTPDAAIAAKILGLNHIWHYREYLDISFRTKLQIKFIHFFSDKILCNSQYTKKFLSSNGIPNTKLEVVYNSFDFFMAKKKISKEKYRTLLGIQDNEFIFGCIGQITHNKGQDIFVDAALKLLKNGFLNTKFVLTGTLENKRYINELKDKIKEKGFEKHFIFTGFRTDVLEIMSSFDVHVMPSRWNEPFGRVALEAIAVDTISIGNKKGGIPEILNQNLLFDSVESLNSLMQSIINKKNTYIDIAKKLKLSAKNKFNMIKYIDTIQNNYLYNDFTAAKGLGRFNFLSKILPGRVVVSYHSLLTYIILTPIWFITILPLTLLFVGILPFILILTKMIHKNTGSVIILAYQAKRNASTRYRVTKIFTQKIFKNRNIKICYPSSEKISDIIYNSLFYGYAPHIKDFYFYFIVWPNRLIMILKSYFYDIAIIQYELFYEGPMFFEKLLAYTHPKTVYDYDDSLYVFDRFSRALPKFLPQVNMVVVGNELLKSYTKQFNKHIVVLPTCPNTIESKNYINIEAEPKILNNFFKIGWVGNPANLCYLPEVKNALLRLQNEFDIVFLIISAGPYKLDAFGLNKLNVFRKEWSIENELIDIGMFDVGLMPVIDDEIGRGKCGFKALQYMSQQVATIASPVGVNKDIIKNGENGFIANNEDEWYTSIKNMITDKQKRLQISQNGNTTVIKNYNIEVVAERWNEILNNLSIRNS